MGPQPFPEPDGSITWDALLEQVAILYSMQWGFDSAVRAIVEGCWGGTMLDYYNDDVVFNINHAYWKDAAGFHGHWTGVQNAAHAVWLAWSAWPNGPLPLVNPNVMSTCDLLAQAAYNKIATLYQGPKVAWLSGHSLGGMVALVLATLYLLPIGFTCHVATFGSGKVFTSTFHPTLPPTVQVSRPGDNVPFLPPTSLPRYIPVIPSVLAYFTSNWVQATSFQEIDGTNFVVRPSNYYDSPVPPFSIGSDVQFTPHWLDKYWADAVAGWTVNGRVDEDCLLAAMGVPLFPAPATIQPVVPAPEGDSDELWYDSLPFPSNMFLSGESKMAGRYMKLSFFIKEDNYGPSENIYMDYGASPSGDIYALALYDATVIATVRRLLMSPSASIDEIRVSDDQVFGDSEVSPLTGLTGQFSATPVGLPTFACLLTRIEAGPNHRGRLFLRGLPGGVSSDPNTFAPTPAWNTAWTKFVNMFLVAAKASTVSIPNYLKMTGVPVLRCVVPETSFKPLTVQLNTPNPLSLTMTFAAAPPFVAPVNGVPGSLVVLKGFKQPNTINKQWRVQSITGTTVVFGPTRRAVTGLPWDTSTGFVYSTAVQYLPWTDFIYRRFGKRDTGRPFDAPVGKRKAR
jgi:Lipase (class 3)